MKTQSFKRGGFGLMLAIAPLVGGCNQPSNGSSQSLATLAYAEPAVTTVAETNATAVPAVPEAPPAPAGKAEAVPAALEEKPLPLAIKASGPVAEVIKLAQAGVDEAVMLTYITNSTSTFSLSSDEIIYLNDIGVPNNVVTTIFEHDQAMKQYWANAAQAQAAASAPAPAPENQAEQTAAAPSYVNPPPAAPAEPQPEVVNDNYFYDTLSPYGSWVNVDGYGLCWQPTVVVVNRGWQPYSDRGHWVYTDCGWYWMSDYSWGATTFHYGRWFSHPRWGWCWWPDRVWGPSWVTWRYGGDYCGWAPLPPAAYYRPGFGFSYYGSSVGINFSFGLGASCYTFVPVSRFCDPHPYRHRLGSHQVTQVFNKTTIINNFGSGSRNTVINHGIAPERITSVTKQEIRKVSIRDEGPAVAKGVRSERLDRDGRTLTVHRPRIPESRNDPRRTTSTTITPDKSSPYAPLLSAPDAGDKSSRANSSTATQNQREESRSVKARSTFGENRSAAGSTARVAPAGSPAAAPTAPATVGSQSTSSPRNAQPSNRSPRTEAAPAPVQQTTPSSSYVVIGKRDGGQPRDRGTVTTPAPQTRLAEVEPGDLQVRSATPATTPQTPVTRSTPSRSYYSQPTVPNAQPSQSPAPARTYNSSPGGPQTSPRQEIPRATRSTEPQNYARPSYSAPAPVQRQPAPSAPSYSPPASTPTPRYDSTPSSRSQAAPSSSPPASAPAPVQRAQPAPSSPPASSPAPAPVQPSGGPRGRNQ